MKVEKKMGSMNYPGIFAMMIAITLATGLSAFSQAENGPSKTPAPPFVCTNATLSGGFATRGSGFAPANPMDPASPLVPFANVSLMTFDGEGGLTNAAVNSQNGMIIPGSNPGSYELNSDCTGTMTIAAPVGVLTFYIVVADRGREFFMISTVRSVVTVEGKRVQ
jgi:hypothetical protein